jgi:hypothetical protein
VLIGSGLERCESQARLWGWGCAESAELLEGELGSGGFRPRRTSRRGGLVSGHGEGVGAADGRAVVPGCAGQVHGPAVVRAQRAAVPLHRGTPAGPGLIKKMLDSAFGVGFSLAWGACGGDRRSSCPGGARVGVGEAVAGSVDPVVQVQ